jgi:hypothetical protein
MNENVLDNTKTCSVCNNSFDFSMFTKDASTSDGYRSKCKNCSKKYWQQYKENNKEKLAHRSQQNRDSRALSNIKRRAKQKGIDFDLTIEDIRNVSICPVFGFKLERANGSGGKPNSPSVDRIDPTKGYTKDNVQVISQLANNMKQDATPEQLLMFADWIYKTYKT